MLLGAGKAQMLPAAQTWGRLLFFGELPKNREVQGDVYRGSIAGLLKQYNVSFCKVEVVSFKKVSFAAARTARQGYDFISLALDSEQEARVDNDPDSCDEGSVHIQGLESPWNFGVWPLLISGSHGFLRKRNLVCNHDFQLGQGIVNGKCRAAVASFQSLWLAACVPAHMKSLPPTVKSQDSLSNSLGRATGDVEKN